MLNVTFETFKLKAQLECLAKAPSLENSEKMLDQILEMKTENFQLVQDAFLSTLLTLMDASDGL